MNRRLPFLFLLAAALVLPSATLFAKTKAEKRRDKILEMRAEGLEMLY